MADPNYAPMYGELRRKVKTDRRDVAALAAANRRGWYRAAHRTIRGAAGDAPAAAHAATASADAQRRVALMRSLVKQEGYRLTVV